MNNLDPSLKRLFDQVGITESELNDKDTANFIYEFIDKHGGLEAVKKDAERPPAPFPVSPAPQSRPPPPPPTCKCCVCCNGVSYSCSQRCILRRRVGSSHLRLLKGVKRRLRPLPERLCRRRHRRTHAVYPAGLHCRRVVRCRRNRRRMRPPATWVLRHCHRRRFRLQLHHQWRHHLRRLCRRRPTPHRRHQ